MSHFWMLPWLNPYGFVGVNGCLCESMDMLEPFGRYFPMAPKNSANLLFCTKELFPQKFRAQEPGALLLGLSGSLAHN